MTLTEDKLPIGVISPYQWSSNVVPVHGEGNAGTEGVDRAVTVAMRRYGIVGCGVCITKDDRVIYCKGFGYKELPEKPFLPTTATRCGSLAKSITALGALVLMDQGKLNLDEKLIPILEKAGIKIKPIDPRVDDITVRELMDHTSGLPGGATYTSWRPNRNLIEALHLKGKPTSREVAADALNNCQLEDAPGKSYRYANANFVLLARVIEAKSGMRFDRYLRRVAMPKFGVTADEIYVSRDQVSPEDRSRGKTEAAYYQTSEERYCSFRPSDSRAGQVFGEAYLGYSTECSDGAGGIAISASGLAKVLANLHSGHKALSDKAVREIATTPGYRSGQSGDFYSKGFVVHLSDNQVWLSHGGMTNHCGGIIGFSHGYQFAAVSNWNSAKAPFVDTYLSRALSQAIARLKPV